MNSPLTCQPVHGVRANWLNTGQYYHTMKTFIHAFGDLTPIF